MKLSTILGATLLLGMAAPLQAQGGGVPTALTGPVKSMRHVSITVSDIDATVAFYSEAVPYAVSRRYRVPGSAFPRALLSKRAKSVDVAIVETPTGIIQLLDFEPGRAATPNPRPVIGPGYTHICFQSASSDPAIARFKAAGLQIISRFGKPDGVDIGGYGVRYAYGRDPDGIMIENESLDKPRRIEPAWLTHIANVVHDRDAMVRFYAALLGREPHRLIEQENRPRLDDVVAIDDIAIKGGWFSVGNMELEVWQYTRPQTPQPSGDRKLDEIGYNSFALEVADLGAEQARLRALGVRLAGAPMTLDGWRVQYGYDPEGNLFAVTAPAAPAKPVSN